MEFSTDAIGSYIEFYGQRQYYSTLPITAGVTTTTTGLITAPDGSRLQTLNVTGRFQIFVAKAGKWESSDGNAVTNGTGGTPSATFTLAAQSVSVTGVDGLGSNAASKVDVDAQLVIIRNNIATLAAAIS